MGLLPFPLLGGSLECFNLGHALAAHGHLQSRLHTLMPPGAGQRLAISLIWDRHGPGPFRSFPLCSPLRAFPPLPLFRPEIVLLGWASRAGLCRLKVGDA